MVERHSEVVLLTLLISGIMVRLEFALRVLCMVQSSHGVVVC